MGSFDFNDFYDAIKNKIEIDPKHKNIGSLSKIYDDHIDFELINVIAPDEGAKAKMFIQISRDGKYMLMRKINSSSDIKELYTHNLYESDFASQSGLIIVPCIFHHTDGTYSYALVHIDNIDDNGCGEKITMFNGEIKTYKYRTHLIMLCYNIPDPFYLPPK